MAIISLWKAPGSKPVETSNRKQPTPSKEKAKVVAAPKPGPAAAVKTTQKTTTKAAKEKPAKRKKRVSTKDQPQPTTPPKKRGRPSKEQVAAREQERLENERARKEQLIAIQQSIFGVPDESSTPQEHEESGFVPNYPIYQVGDDVELVNPSLVPGESKRRGRVTRHDISSAWVHVRWTDKCTDWRHATTLLKLTDLREKSGGRKRGRPKKGS